MSPEFWAAVLSAPSAEFDGIMERLESYECREKERWQREQRERIEQQIEQITRRGRHESERGTV